MNASKQGANVESWGGSWTEKKLEAFSKYVWSYLSIMKNHPHWKTIYFDGFAGDGDRHHETQNKLYKQLHLIEKDDRTYKGSAERVLQLKDGLKFDYYYFIDTNQDSLKKLENRLRNLPYSQDKQLSFRQGDANLWLNKLGEVITKESNKYAALIFLDPFGMHINWDSIASLKETRSDIWILVPTGVIVNRLLDKKGNLKSIDKLESFFGLSEEAIKEIFYVKKTDDTLFGEEETIVKIPYPIEKITEMYIKQLRTVWKHVTPKPLILKNSKGVPIFHFVFASNNETAVKIAHEIVEKT